MVTFAGPLATLGTLAPADWSTELLVGFAGSNPTSWGIVSPNVLRVDGFALSGALTFTNRFRKIGSSVIPFANGSSLTSIPFTPMSVTM